VSKKEFDKQFLCVIDLVYSLGVRLFYKDIGSVQDFVQDIYIHALKKRNLFARKSKFSTWIYRLALNQGLNKIKKNKNFMEDSVDSAKDYETIDFSEPVLTKIIKNEETVLVQQTIYALPQVQRLILILYFYEHYSYSQIAEELGMQEGTVKSHMHRAKKYLAYLLKERGL